MATLDNFLFTLLVSGILSLTIFITLIIYFRYKDSSPVLSLIVCGLIFFFMICIVYNLYDYGINMGWVTPSTSMSNLTSYR